MPRKSSKTSQVTVERPTFLAGFSMGSKYHEDRTTIQHQLDLVGKKSAKTYTFLSDIQHWSSTVAARINNDLDLTEEGFEKNKLKIENDALYESYTHGQNWLKNNQDLIDSSYEGASDVEELSGDDTVQTDEADDSSGNTTPEHSDASIMPHSISFSPWASFDSDTAIRLMNILTEKGLDLPEISEEPIDKLKSLLFKSIFLNSIIYYYQGSLITLDSLGEKKLDNKYIEKQKEVLGEFEQALDEHNTELKNQNVPNIYEKYAFDGTKKSVSFAKNFSNSIFCDISTYLNRNQAKGNSKSPGNKKSNILINDPDWRVQLSIMYSVQHQCQNLASIGVYSLVHGVTYFTYPRNLGNSPNLFSNTVLPLLISTLYKEHPELTSSDKSPALNYKDHLTFFYKDNTTLYSKDDDRLAFQDGDYVVIEDGITRKLEKVPPIAAQSKVLVPKSSIRPEIIKEMQNATKGAMRYFEYSLQEGNAMSIKAGALFTMSKNFPQEFIDNNEDFYKTLFNWAQIETRDIQEHFRKSSSCEEEKNKIREALCKILFILELIRCVHNKIMKDNNYMEPVMMHTLRHFSQSFTKFLLSIEKSENIKDLLTELYTHLSVESINSLSRAGNYSPSDKMNISLDWKVTKNILIECIDEQFKEDNTKQSTPPRRPRSGSQSSSKSSSPIRSNSESSKNKSGDSDVSSQGSVSRDLYDEFNVADELKTRPKGSTLTQASINVPQNGGESNTSSISVP
ncbi:MAG: hypothetical protein VX835_02655 [Pseudomonadota bacterium]|nr:hypothetical protein [Pseudomonadota bacterium]